MNNSCLLFDSHAHLTAESVYPHLPDYLTRAYEANIRKIVNICTNPLSLERGLSLVPNYPWVFNAAATTPHGVAEEGEAVFPIIAKAARQGLLIAIGETGLDYHYYAETKDIQQDFLRRYLRLALECQLPVIIHCREAFADLFRILDEDYQINGKHAPGVLHCFTGTVEEAQEVIARGWTLSLSGIVTFKKSEVLRTVAASVPLDQLLIETDTPYLAPQSKRGKPNEPAYLIETAACIAQARGIPLAELAHATWQNATRLFGH